MKYVSKDGRIILKDIDWEDVKWIRLVQNRDQWQTVENMAMNHQVT